MTATGRKLSGESPTMPTGTVHGVPMFTEPNVHRARGVSQGIVRLFPN